jgi:hypothetical protein
VKFETITADIQFMRISSGISEIHFHTPMDSARPSERVFIWPLYNAGRVERLHGITRQTESNAIYAKPSSDDREKILMTLSSRSEVTYTDRGSQRSHQLFGPGSLFDAVV